MIPGSLVVPPEGSSLKTKAPTVFIRSRHDDDPSGSKPLPTFDPESLIGTTFLLPPEENGERQRAKGTRKVVEVMDQEDGHRLESINSILEIGNGKVEELISYNRLLDQKQPKKMALLWIKNFICLESSLDTKVL